jgi:hypothetical protein
MAGQDPPYVHFANPEEGKKSDSRVNSLPAASDVVGSMGKAVASYWLLVADQELWLLAATVHWQPATDHRPLFFAARTHLPKWQCAGGELPGITHTYPLLTEWVSKYPKRVTTELSKCAERSQFFAARRGSAVWQSLKGLNVIEIKCPTVGRGAGQAWDSTGGGVSARRRFGAAGDLRLPRRVGVGKRIGIMMFRDRRDGLKGNWRSVVLPAKCQVR